MEENSNQKYRFLHNERLGIRIPQFDLDWDEYNQQEQISIIREWEKERARIPDRIKDIELKIEEMQDLMFEIEFEEYIKIHEQIVDMASAINDLNIWYRTEGEITK